MIINPPSSSSRWWICLHLPDSPLSSGECSHSGSRGNTTSPGVFFQSQKTLCRCDERHGTNRRGSAQNWSQPQHAEQQGQVGHTALCLWSLLDSEGDRQPCKARWSFSSVFCCFQNSIAWSCGIGEWASVQPATTVQTVSHILPANGIKLVSDMESPTHNTLCVQLVASWDYYTKVIC